MKREKTKSKAKTPRKKPSKKRPEKFIKAALEPYRDKHPVFVAVETLEGQARRLLEAEGFPSDLDTLATFHEPPLGRRQDPKAEAAWLKTFKEVHCRFFPEDAGKVLTRRGALLKRVLWQAERTREAIKSGDPEGAALHAIRLMQAAERAREALTHSTAGRAPKRPEGILQAIRDEVEMHGDNGATWLWGHFQKKHADPIHLEIEALTFDGEVFFSESKGKLVQEPSLSSGGRRAEIGWKAFEKHYSALFPRKNPS